MDLGASPLGPVEYRNNDHQTEIVCFGVWDGPWGREQKIPCTRVRLKNNRASEEKRNIPEEE